MQQTDIVARELTKCGNHEDRSGTYFLSEQPWIKFCSECALNVALYGRKIQKHLTETQIRTKTNINTYRKQLQSRLQELETTKSTYEKLLTQVQPNQQNLSEVLKSIDEYICELAGIRDSMKQQYEHNIHKTIEQCHERQTKILLEQIQIKRQIEYVHIQDKQIQNNYGNLIDDQLKVEPKKQDWAQLLQVTEGIVLGPDGTTSIQAAIEKGQVEIRNSISLMNNIKLIDKLCLKTIFTKQLHKSVEQVGSQNKDSFMDFYDSVMSSSLGHPKQPNTEASKKFSKLKLRSRSKQNTLDKNCMSDKHANSRKKARYSLRDKTNITNMASMSTLTTFNFD